MRISDNIKTAEDLRKYQDLIFYTILKVCLYGTIIYTLLKVLVIVGKMF